MSKSEPRMAATPLRTTRQHTLGEAKLKSSGLDLSDAHVLGMEFLNQTQTSNLCSLFKPLCSLYIPYYDHMGAPLSDLPAAQAQFYRLRYLEQPEGFDKLTGRKPIRYVQMPDTVPVAYYPRNQPWAEICANPSDPLILTEGELKAAKACKEGFPTVGLGGVWNWRALRKGLEWLPSLDLVHWIRRAVYIVFDSDYRSNELVCSALHDLAEELSRRGAFCHIVSLPALDGLDKTGLDDFLVNAGPSALEQFQVLLRDAEPLGLTKHLWRMNEKYAYVQGSGFVIDRATRAKATPSAFKEHLESTLNYQERLIKKDGTISFKTVSAAGVWLKWPLRQEVSKLTYAPGHEQLVSAEGVQAFNIWPGWGAEPKQGDVTPWLELLDHLFSTTERQALEWFLQWCAYPIQHPGTKLFSCCMFHGVREGTGKSLVGYTLGRIYGKNFSEINQMDLHNHFNEWLEAKQFVMGDDVTGSDKRSDMDFLKKLITQSEVRINSKYIPTYSVPDYVNYFFTANHPDAFFLADNDRRFFVHEVQVSALPEDFYMSYHLWLNSKIGPSALHHFLLQVDTTGFNPAAPAFMTAAKERMINTTRSDLASWVRQLIDTPDQILRVGDIIMFKDLWTSKELLQLYDPEAKTNVTAGGMGRELGRADIRQVFAGQPIKTGDGVQARYYILRDHHRWMRAKYKEIVDYLNKMKARDSMIPKYRRVDRPGSKLLSQDLEAEVARMHKPKVKRKGPWGRIIRVAG